MSQPGKHFLNLIILCLPLSLHSCQCVHSSSCLTTHHSCLVQLTLHTIQKQLLPCEALQCCFRDFYDMVLLKPLKLVKRDNLSLLSFFQVSTPDPFFLFCKPESHYCVFQCAMLLPVSPPPHPSTAFSQLWPRLC